MIPGQEPSHEAMRALTYAKYARRHDWTPWQVDNELYAWLDDWLLPIEDLIEEVASERSRGRTPQAG